MELIGWAGTALVIVAYLPQIHHLLIEKCAWGISILTWMIWLIASTLLLFYCLLRRDFMMKGSNHSWRGETGHVDKKMLARFIGNLIGPIYYAAGPPAMVTAMREMLNNAGASEDVIRFEEFSGYC